MNINVITGDCRELLAAMPDQSVHCCVTSPPYFGLRDYGVDGQIGLETTPAEFVERLVAVFREVRRVLRDDGTLWLNLGDSYAADTKGDTKGSSGVGDKQTSNRGTLLADRKWAVPDGLKRKDLIGIPWRVAFALQADGWYLRQDIIWSKPNPMPESVRDRCTKAHEYIFLLSKSPRYYFDAEAIKEPAQHPKMRHKSERKSEDQERAYHGNAPTNLGRCGTAEDGKRNRRSVWTVTTKPFNGAHFATFPPDLIEPCVLAGCPAGGMVLDPFGGAGTTGFVAKMHGRAATLIELNPEYAAMARERIAAWSPQRRKTAKEVKSETERADAIAAHILALREMPDDMRELSVRMECEFLMREVWRTAWLSGFRAAAAGARDEHLNAVKSA